MNTFFSPQPPTSSRISPGPVGVPPHALPPHRPHTLKNALSAGQLLDVELGLFLLSQLLPTAPPDALPALMGNAGSSFSDRPTWTAKQNKYLNRGRALLGHCLQPAIWSALIERYAAATTTLSAYDVSRDRRWFGEKTVGFSRNRMALLRKMLAYN